jgi:two-component system, NarL family, response regulator LiaR
MSIKVLIADDHDVVRHGLATFLSLDSELEIVGMATNGDEALQLVRDLQPEVLLLDLRMPGKTGFEVLAALRSEPAAPKTLVLSSVMERAAIQKALRLGAHGFLLKDTSGQALCDSIKASVNEEVKPQLSTPVKKIMRGRQETAKKNPPAQLLVEALTRREKEVLTLIVRGLSNKQIAEQLTINEKTVKTYVSNLLCKLDAQSRTQATLKALQIGLVSES